VLFRLGQVLSVFVCIYLAGGHWAVLQTAAWAGMLADYGRSYGVEKAVAMTFDGDHPCKLCCKIEAAKKRESTPDLPGRNLGKAAKKNPVVPAGKSAALRELHFSLTSHQAVHLTGNTRREAPPQPPPRITVA
jgi:hypothetical protein